MCENYEHILSRLRPSTGINERLCNVRVIHVQIASQNTPQDALERRDTGTVDSASNESVCGSVQQW